jgi:hypothetical protein
MTASNRPREGQALDFQLAGGRDAPGTDNRADKGRQEVAIVSIARREAG